MHASLIAIADCELPTGVSPELRTRSVRKLSDEARWLRGQRSTGYEEREIDKAHVLRTAESPWLEVSTVGLSCRLLIAGTMQQMALIAIPTRSSHSRILLRSLSLSNFLSLFPFSSLPPLFLSPLYSPDLTSSPQWAPLFRRSRRFSRILPRGLPPRRSVLTSRDSMCSISSRRQACHLRAENVEILSWSLFQSDRLHT